MAVISKETSSRISILRFSMIAGIVVLHLPPYEPITDVAEGAFPFLKAFVSGALFRATVPVLTCISGYLLFQSCLDQKIPLLLTKKVKRLVVPFLLANVPLVALLYVAQANGFFRDFSAQLYPFDMFTILDKILGLATGPVNYPLGFLRDLVVLSLLAPALGRVLRNAPWAGLICLGWLVLTGADGSLVLRDTMFLNFYIGGMVAVLSWDLGKLDRFAPAFAVALVAICALMVEFGIEDRALFSVVSPFLIWPISSMFLGTRIGDFFERLAPHSFFVFLTHAPVLLGMWLIYKRFDVVPYEVFWIVTPIMTIAICVAGRMCLEFGGRFLSAGQARAQ